MDDDYDEAFRKKTKTPGTVTGCIIECSGKNCKTVIEKKSEVSDREDLLESAVWEAAKKGWKKVGTRYYCPTCKK